MSWRPRNLALVEGASCRSFLRSPCESANRWWQNRKGFQPPNPPGIFRIVGRPFKGHGRGQYSKVETGTWVRPHFRCPGVNPLPCFVGAQSAYRLRQQRIRIAMLCITLFAAINQLDLRCVDSRNQDLQSGDRETAPELASASVSCCSMLCVAMFAIAH